MEELVGAGVVARYTHRRPRRRQRRTRRRRRGGRDADPVAARVRGGGRAHRHRVRRAALLRRLQRRPQGGLPGARRHRDHPGGAPSPPHRGRPGHLRHRAPATRCTTSSAPRRRWRRRTCRSTSRSTGNAGSPPSSPARCPTRTTPPARTCRPRRCAGSAHRSTSSSRPTAGTRSTATSTRPSRAWPPPSASCATAGSSSWPPPARTGCPPAAPSPACWREATTPAQLAGATGGPELDRWQAQVLGRVLSRAEVRLHSAGLEPADDRGRAARAGARSRRRGGGRAGAVSARGRGWRCIPEGPLTVATVDPLRVRSTAPT